MKSPRSTRWMAIGLGLATAAPVVYRDQPYGPLATQRVDVYVPAGATTPLPLVVWIHGDGWSNGTKALPATAYQLRMATYRHTVLASCDYRGETTATFPAGLIDVENCVRWLKRNAARFHIDTSRVALWGASHGAFLVDWMLSTCGDTLWTGYAGECFRGGIALFGAPDLVRFRADRAGNRALNGCPPPDSMDMIPTDSLTLRAISTLYRVRPGLAPSMHLHGAMDCKTPWQGSYRMDSALVTAGVPSVYRLYLTFAHGGAAWQVDTVYKPQLAYLQTLLR